MKKYILFDNDGVLVETEKWYYEACKRVMKEFFNITIQFDDYMQIMSEGTTVWQKALTSGYTQDDVIIARNKRNVYYQEYLNTKDLSINDVETIIKELSKTYKMAIVTTSRREDFEIIHKNKLITKYMEFILCEEDYEFAKPHPRPYLDALNKFNATKEETIIIEDSKRGLSSAYSAGIECVIVHNEFTKTQDFTQSSYKINTLSDLPLLLKNINIGK
jgi:HAD superfamily hydrolase (TIGR01509 family)